MFINLIRKVEIAPMFQLTPTSRRPTDRSSQEDSTLIYEKSRTSWKYWVENDSCRSSRLLVRFRLLAIFQNKCLNTIFHHVLMKKQCPLQTYKLFTTMNWIKNCKKIIYLVQTSNVTQCTDFNGAGEGLLSSLLFGNF